MGFVLAEYNYRDDAVFATIYNGRNDSRLSRSITMQVLYRMGSRWPLTSAQYMKRFLEALIGLNFFD